MKLEARETRSTGTSRTGKHESATATRRQRVSQSDVPALSLTAALRIAKAICDNYNLRPTRPFLVAQALDLAPTTGHFRMLCGAAIAYNLTEGGYNAEQISLTDLGRRIVSPTAEGDENVAMVTAFMRPRIIREFMNKYSGGKFPKDRIAQNVLVELGLPRDSADRVYKLIQEDAQTLGLLKSINGELYVDLDSTGGGEHQNAANSALSHSVVETAINKVPEVQAPLDFSSKHKMFIAHGKDKTLIPDIHKILACGLYEGIVAVERATVAKPLSKKVLDDMQPCSAAIILVTSEAGQDGASSGINANVLIEIGMSLILFSGRVILLVENGVEVPSNLAGLYQVRFNGASLDAETAIKLLEVCKDLRQKSNA